MTKELEHTKEQLRKEKYKNAELARENFDLNATIAELMEENDTVAARVEEESKALIAEIEEDNENLAGEVAGLAKEKGVLVDKIESLESELSKAKLRARANKRAKKELGKIKCKWKNILYTLGDDVKE
jgi:cell division protein FtsB